MLVGAAVQSTQSELAAQGHATDCSRRGVKQRDAVAAGRSAPVATAHAAQAAEPFSRDISPDEAELNCLVQRTLHAAHKGSAEADGHHATRRRNGVHNAGRTAVSPQGPLPVPCARLRQDAAQYIASRAACGKAAAPGTDAGNAIGNGRDTGAQMRSAARSAQHGQNSALPPLHKCDDAAPSADRQVGHAAQPHTQAKVSADAVCSPLTAAHCTSSHSAALVATAAAHAAGNDQLQQGAAEAHAYRSVTDSPDTAELNTPHCSMRCSQSLTERVDAASQQQQQQQAAAQGAHHAGRQLGDGRLCATNEGIAIAEAPSVAVEDVSNRARNADEACMHNAAEHAAVHHVDNVAASAATSDTEGQFDTMPTAPHLAEIAPAEPVGVHSNMLRHVLQVDSECNKPAHAVPARVAAVAARTDGSAPPLTAQTLSLLKAPFALHASAGIPTLWSRQITGMPCMLASWLNRLRHVQTLVTI